MSEDQNQPTPPPPSAPPPQSVPPVGGQNWSQPPGPQQFQQQSSSGFDSLIPTKNPDALLSYYTGLFAIIPIVGLILGPLSLVKGKSGLTKVKEVPQMPGKAHAYVGIGCGSIGLLFNLLILGLIIAGIIAAANR